MRNAEIHPKVSHGIMEHNGKILEHNRANFVELPESIIGKF